MSWSLRITHGDLAISGASLDVVTAEQKLAQDMRCWILERMGTDSLHPTYGSLLDGGRRNGREVPSLIGRVDVSLAALEAEADIRRIVLAYQQQQLARAQRDRSSYGRATLTRGEVVTGIASIQMLQDADTLTILLVVKTAGRGPITIDIPLTTDI